MTGWCLQWLSSLLQFTGLNAMIEITVAKLFWQRKFTCVNFKLQKREAACLRLKCRLNPYLMQTRLQYSADTNPEKLNATGVLVDNTNYHATVCFIQSLILSGSHSTRAQQSTRLLRSSRDYTIATPGELNTN